VKTVEDAPLLEMDAGFRANPGPVLERLRATVSPN
jgi:hypothetical protein